MIFEEKERTKMNKQATPIRTAIYVRVDAGKQGDECAAQVQRLKEFIEKDTHLILAGVYADDGLPANAPRPEWEKLLADCDAGQYDAIFAMSLSRLERSTFKLVQITDRLANANVRIITLKEDCGLLPLILGSVIADG